jgi:hypothetical protein
LNVKHFQRTATRKQNEERTPSTNGQANTARPFFCLQEESGPAGTGGRNDDGVLPAKLAEACKTRADPGRSMASRMQTDKFSSPNACKTISSVEKRLHIHSSKCAEAAFLLAKPFLSKIGSAPVQCFSSSSGST